MCNDSGEYKRTYSFMHVIDLNCFYSKIEELQAKYIFYSNYLWTEFLTSSLYPE